VLSWNADSNSYYVVILADPDAPSRANPTFREFAHWMIVNIPGNDISKGEIKYQYIGSGAPQGTGIIPNNTNIKPEITQNYYTLGLHRYVFMIYKQNEKHDFSFLPYVSNKSRQNRRSFSTK
jgi:phosphatidylethanolamine-binding protein (PEBP) family uncharacterized protein